MMADAGHQALLELAAQIGVDPNLAQGATGGVSLKRDGVMWVSASGTCLAHAATRETMVSVRLAADGDVMAFVVAEQNAHGLHPSVETAMHAVLPHPVVIHVHCVETIAWAVQQGAERLVASRLAGLNWRFVPYARPGAALARAILARIRPRTDVLVLGNHGLVVCGETVEAAEALLFEVQQCLCRPVREAPAGDIAALTALAAGTDYVPAVNARTHGIGTDPASFAVARRGSLYPDHVMVLGPGIATFPPVGPHPRAMLIVAGLGVLMRHDAPPDAHALARCLADVTARLDPGDTLAVLTGAQEAELLG